MKEKLINVLSSFKGKKILVLGDMIIDEYWYGDVKRVSREAPILILEHNYSESVLGGAANVVNNIVALSGEVMPMSIISNDESGKKIIGFFKNMNVNCDCVLLDEDKNSRTPTKIRILAGSLHTSKQQTLRVDMLGKKGFSNSSENKLIELIKNKVKEFDVLLVSDYNLGVVSDKVIELINHIALSIPVVVDSRYNLHKFRNAFIITPNEEEAVNVLKEEFSENNLSEMPKKLAEKLNSRAGLITRGKNGMILYDGKNYFNIPVVGSNEAVDVTGAGDTVSSVISMALASGAEIYDSALIANVAASVAVMKRGNVAVSINDIYKVLDNYF